MSSIKLQSALFAGLSGFASGAIAHTGMLSAEGLPDGFLHPFQGMDHLLVMLGVGLWAATRKRHVAGQIVALFLLYMLGGALLGLHGVEFAFVETAIFLSLLVIGILLAIGRLQLPGALAAALIAVSAVMHGLAHGAEIPQTASAYPYLTGMLLATGLLHGLGLGCGLLLGRFKTGMPLRLYGAATGIFGVCLLLTSI